MDAPIFVDTSPRTPEVAGRRFSILYILLVVLCGTLAARSFHLQILRGSSLLAHAEGNRVAITPITAPRGIIYDYRHQQLVENIATTDLVLDPLLLPTEEQEGPLIERLPTYIPIDVTRLRESLTEARTTQRSVVLAASLDHTTVLKLEEVIAELPGLRLTSSLVRKYPYQYAAAHSLGYTSPITADEVPTKHYLPTDITGKTGLERQYDETLHGTHGAVYREVNAQGLPQKELGKEPATPGADLTLSLDIELQQYIYQLFNDRAAAHTAGPTAGAVIALDPRTGGVRALVSFPSYDPNLFSQPALNEGAAALFKAELEPLFNRAVDGSYPPGSTIKPFLAAAALEERIVTPSTVIHSSGGISVGPWRFPDWKAGGHGPTMLGKAIAESVNTYFYTIVGGYESQPGLGVERAVKHLQKFGWGKPTAIDLPTEAAGLLPTPDWKQATKHERWYIGDTYHLGIGQGDVAVTPLQIASSTASLANGGTWRTPHLVETVVRPNLSPETLRWSSHNAHLTPATRSAIQAAMRQTVTEGSGRSLLDLPVALAGKTGTAQIGGSDATHAWFTSYGPSDTPELVITVLLEKGGEGDEDAVAFAKHIWRWWIEHRYTT